MNPYATNKYIMRVSFRRESKPFREASFRATHEETEKLVSIFNLMHCPSELRVDVIDDRAEASQETPMSGWEREWKRSLAKEDQSLSRRAADEQPK